MGWNTVAILLNDHTHEMPESVQQAMREFGNGLRWREGDFSWGRIISHDHADGNQIVVVHGNTGHRLTSDPDDGFPEHALKALQSTLDMRAREARHRARLNSGVAKAAKLETE